MKSFKTRLAIENYEEALAFVRGALEKHKIKELQDDRILIFEELFIRAASSEQGRKPDALITISEFLGESKISIGYSGDRFLLDFEQGDTLDIGGHTNPGSAILSMYSDKINVNYKRGYNTLTLTASESASKSMLVFLSIIGAAIIVSMMIKGLLTPQQCSSLNEDFINPLGLIFGNAIIMISPPIVFISLVRNITTVYAITDHRFKIRRTILRVIATSMISIMVGIITYEGFYWFVETMSGFAKVERVGRDQMSASGLINSFFNIMPDSISGVFDSDAPFSLILFAFIVAGAICISGKHFNTLKAITDVFYTLVSKMLSVVMLFMPIFLFISMIDSLICSNIVHILLNYLILIIVVALGILAIGVIICIRILAAGGKPVKFMQALFPAILANLRINSSIDAVPYNIRFCHKTFRIPFGKLGINLPIMAQISLSGNCFFVTFLTLGLCSIWGIPMEPSKVIMIGLMAFAFSIGAPGQPGGTLVGIVMMTTFMGISVAKIMPTLIIIEVLFGSMLTLMNTVEDLIEVAMEQMAEDRRKRKRTA